MNASARWQTDECCPRCGGLLWARLQVNGGLTQECGCGWYGTWAPGPDEGER
jgi:hypothetical protein